MLFTIIALFIITAIFGVYMFGMVSGNKPRPNWSMLLHGAFAATAVSLLIYYSAMHAEESAPTASIAFFIIAVFIGFAMLLYDKIMNRRLPFYFPLIHAGTALTGLILLIIYVLKHT